MKLVILSVVIIGSLGTPAVQNLSINEDGTYQFSYETGNEGGSHSRTESKGPDGAVIGKYSYRDPTGELREVNYRADDEGFRAGVDGEVPQPSASELPEAAINAEGSERDNKEDLKDETKSPSTTEATEDDDDEEEEEKSLKLEEPVYDGPPEGFPLGFFSEQFSALRRLAEPKPTKKKADGKTDEPSTDGPENAGQDPQGQFSAGWQPEGFPPGFFLHHFTGLRRLEEPVQESSQTIDDTKSDDPDSGATTSEEKNTRRETYSPYILPFPPLVPRLWPASSHHQPVYVYSYQQPNAYSYGYYY